MNAAHLVSGCRYEVIPLKSLDEQIETLDPQVPVTVTCSPRKGIDATVAVTRRLAVAGVHVIPHVAARQVKGPEHLSELLDAFAKVGVRDIFVPGGDIDEPVGEYDSSLALLRDMRRVRHSIERVGIAAYPEGHVKIDDRELARALDEKSVLADYMVTQICFSAPTVREWLQCVRRRGIELELFIGVPGVHSLTKLLSISMKIGVGPSLRFLRKQRGLLRQTLRPGNYSPAELVHDLATELTGADKVAGLHVFTFNQIALTERWRTQVLETGTAST